MPQVQQIDATGAKADFILSRVANNNVVVRFRADIDMTEYSGWWAGVTAHGETIEVNVDTSSQDEQFVIAKVPASVADQCGLREWLQVWANDPNGDPEPVLTASLLIEDPKVAP